MPSSYQDRFLRAESLFPVAFLGLPGCLFSTLSEQYCLS